MTSPLSTRTSKVEKLLQERRFRRRCYIASMLIAVLISTVTNSAIWSSDGIWAKMKTRCSACGRLGAENVHGRTLGPNGAAYYTCQPEQPPLFFIPPPAQSILNPPTDDR